LSLLLVGAIVVGRSSSLSVVISTFISPCEQRLAGGVAVSCRACFAWGGRCRAVIGNKNV
jgi:hypothetical protein